MRRTCRFIILLAACIGALAGCGGNDASLSGQTVAAKSLEALRSQKAAQAADYETLVQELYISYFGRPADPGGLANFEAALLAAGAPADAQGLASAYPTNATIRQLVNNFSTSAESIALYGSGTTTSFVTAIYANLLGRAPDSGGLAYWVGQINLYTSSGGGLGVNMADAALAIMAGALSNTTAQGILDGELVTNRIAVAEYFTAQVTALNATSAYSGNAAALSARTMLGTVTAATDTTSAAGIAAYEATVNADIAALIAALTNNVQPIIVDAGPAGLSTPAIDEAFTSVTVCAPGSTTVCQTIDHVLIDTGSTGLRLMYSVLSPALASALSTQTTGSTLVECISFVDLSYIWGPVRSVDLQIAGESALGANGMLMQVIGDPSFSSVPSTCPNGNGNGYTGENTVNSFGANGIIGVGLFLQDCGAACVPQNAFYQYYTCSSSSCAPATASLAQQVPNPVSLFAADNNGLIITLPSVPAGGAASVSGTMTFGVGTQSNNALGSAAVIQMDPNTGWFTTVFAGSRPSTLTDSYIDSGSNGLYFPDTAIAECPYSSNFYTFFCPAFTTNLSATMESFNYSTSTPTLIGSQSVGFSIVNPDIEYAANPAYAVYGSFGAPQPGTTFDWGLPFFFGRNVFVVTENQTVSGHTGPFNAFSP